VARDVFGNPTSESIVEIAKWPKDDLDGLFCYFLEAWDRRIPTSVRVVGFECDQLGVFKPVRALILDSKDSMTNEALIAALKCSPLWKQAWLLTAREGINVLNLSLMQRISGQSR
jgi:hypothetical protein